MHSEMVLWFTLRISPSLDPVSRPVVPSYFAPQLTDRLETAIRKVMKSIDVGNKGQNNYAKIDCRPGST